MTAQKKILDLTGTEYLVNKITGKIPVKISDLQDDVALGTHIADNDIHVTTADKNKWNNQSYVFRYSSTTLVASSTNSNALLDNTDNLKVGDKVIDSSGVLFSITAIDTANSTFTIGTALIDLAQDSGVVHKSGNETIGGEKTFTNQITNNITNKVNAYITLKNSSYDPKTNGQSNANSGSFSIGFNTLTDDSFAYITAYGLPEYSMLRLTTTYFTDSENSITDSIEYRVYQNGDRSLKPRNNNNCMLGETSRRWSKIYGTEYYYGSNNVEFSTKFVTTDAAQTISGTKYFTVNPYIYNPDSNASTPSLILGSSKSVRGTSDTDVQAISFNDKNNDNLGSIKVQNFTANGATYLQNTVNTKDTNNQVITASTSLYILNNGRKVFRPNADNDILLGYTGSRWKDVNTYLVNGLEPSSLSLPSDRSARIDISSYITNLGNGGNNVYTVPANGYIFLRFTSINGAICYSQTSGGMTNYAQTFARYQGDGQLYAFFPVRKDDTFVVQIYTSSTAVVESAYFIPCQGNV